MFNTSHARHHRYTLAPARRPRSRPAGKSHPLANVPVRHLQSSGDLVACRTALAGRPGQIQGRMGVETFPARLAGRKAAMRWARVMLIGHGLIIAIAVYFHLWMLPFLTTFSAFVFGGGLQALCKCTQHIGLQDDVVRLPALLPHVHAESLRAVPLLAHELSHRASYVRRRALLQARPAASPDQTRSCRPARMVWSQLGRRSSPFRRSRKPIRNTSTSPCCPLRGAWKRQRPDLGGS